MPKLKQPHPSWRSAAEPGRLSLAQQGAVAINISFVDTLDLYLPYQLVDSV